MTRDVIEPILTATYGTGPKVKECAKDLADSIDGYVGEERESMVMMRCWHWFTGGSTAKSVARKIEAALAGGPPCTCPAPPNEFTRTVATACPVHGDQGPS